MHKQPQILINNIFIHPSEALVVSFYTIMSPTQIKDIKHVTQFRWFMYLINAG